MPDFFVLCQPNIFLKVEIKCFWLLIHAIHRQCNYTRMNAALIVLQWDLRLARSFDIFDTKESHKGKLHFILALIFSLIVKVIFLTITRVIKRPLCGLFDKEAVHGSHSWVGEGDTWVVHDWQLGHSLQGWQEGQLGQKKRAFSSVWSHYSTICAWRT